MIWVKDLLGQAGYDGLMKSLRHFTKIVAPMALLLVSPRLAAHCDSLDGPVVLEARESLQSGDVAPLLKWVEAEHEAEIADAFARARAVLARGDANARSLAETWFLETLVRVHREGEGEPYTGLKPAGHIDEAVMLADEALEAGEAQDFAVHLGAALARSILERFEVAAHKKEGAAADPEAGRAFVAAYVEYVHLVEAAHRLIAEGAAHAH